MSEDRVIYENEMERPSGGKFDAIEAIVKELKSSNPYPESIFPEISTQDLAIIHDFLRREMGFPIDRLSGHLGRKIYKSIIDDLIEKLKEANNET